MRSLLNQVGLTPGGLHAFRHGRVSVLQTSGVPGDLIKDWIGHSSLNQTARYTHFRDDFRNQMASNVGLFAQAISAV